MCRMQCLLVLVALSMNLVKCWDFAVTNGDQLEFYTNGTKTSEGLRFRKLTALAYDAVHNMLLFVDQQNDNASIFSYHIAIKKFQPLVRKRKIVEDIQGLTFDPITSTLFWTDVTERSIYSFSLAPKAKNNPYGNLLFKMDVEKPRSIVVDSCRGYIYWSNININNPTIERARFDGTDREIIISKNHSNLYMPVSITIDQQSGRLYWVDDEEGIHYSIRSSDLDGSHINVELKAQRHKPNSLTVSNSSLYWIDLDNEKLWKLPKNSNNTVEPEDIVNFQDKQPYDIVANYRIEDQTANVTQCEDLARLTQRSTVLNEYISTISEKEGLYCLHGKTVNGRMQCECTPGYSGERCQTSVCHNYCLQGDCSVTAEGNPICRCKDGFSGQRCDVDRCNNYCLNDATCAIDPVNKAPVCTCQKDHEGMRCEVTKTINDKEQTVTEVVMRKEEIEPCNCTEDKSAVVETCDAWDPVRDPIMMVLGIFSGVLCVVCAVLVTKILQLKKRPRIKKRIIVNKNVTPLTARPDQCEITIENCCNMNICETPCFEPRSTIRPTLLDSKPGKEEKRNLISNMEQPDDF